MGTVLFIIVLIASWIVVRIGAVAFQLTGLEWSLAKFQSLSCFSGTGFTTKYVTRNLCLCLGGFAFNWSMLC